MHTFVVVHSDSFGTTERLVHRASQALRQQMPSNGRRLVSETKLFPECGVGWAAVMPDEDTPCIDQYVSDHHGVLVFGSVEGVASASQAPTVLRAWESGGAEEILRLDGTFAWVVVDRMSGTLTIGGDSVGTLSPYFARSGESLVASVHDLSIVATGEVGVDVDLAQVYAAICRQWSPQGRSFLSTVERVQPNTVLCSGSGGVQAIGLAAHPFESRIDARDANAVRTNNDALVEAFRSAVDNRTQGTNEVAVTLSAGMDSRAVLAAAVASVDRSRIRAVSSGDPQTEDVRTAKRLAALERIAFRNPPVVPPSVEQFVENSGLFAFAMNGDLCEGGSLFQVQPPVRQADAPTVLFGSCGEIFRGAARSAVPYGILAAHKGRLTSPNAAEAAIVGAIEGRFSSLPPTDPDFVEQARRRIEDSVRALRDLSDNAYDMLDLYYFYERAGVWAKTKARQTWQRYKVPFHSGHLVDLLWRMPSPIGFRTDLHAECIRRYMPEALWIPINGRLLIPTLDQNWLHRTVAAWIHARSIVRRARKKALRIAHAKIGGSKAKPAGDMGAHHQAMLRGDLSEFVDSLVYDDGNIGLQTLGRRKIDELVRRGDVKSLVSLVVAENWRRLAIKLATCPIDTGEAAPVDHR